jgi:DNA-directed RNA polymerase
MATRTQIKQQFELEKEAISCGRQRLHESVQRLEEKSYASASVYGTASISAALPLVIKEIEKSFSKQKRGAAGQHYQPVSKYISELEPLAIATIALKVIFDNVFSMKRDADLLANVLVSIGSALEAECKFRWYRKEDPKIMKKLEDRYFHESCGTQQKIKIASVMYGRDGIVWPSWNIKTRSSLGSWCLNSTIIATGWFTKEITQRSKRRKESRVVPTPEFNKVRDKVIKTAEMFSGIPWPMVLPPNPWSVDSLGIVTYGGYFTNQLMKGHELTRRGIPTLKHGNIPLAFLNKLQQVRYRVSTHVLEVANTFYDKGRVVGKFIPITEAFKPPKPPDIEENEKSKQAYCRQTAEANNADRINFKRSVRTRTQLDAAKKFKDEVFYLCWSFDYRGRAYPIQSFLTPQDTDFGKALIRFADESPVNDEAETWLAFQVATTYGLDKKTLDERQTWVKENHSLITDIATDPIDSLPKWEVAEEPWQFMAACHEYYHCCIKKDKSTTGLMVAVDATCSGLQILAGLAKDQSTAELVNVCPGNEPSDAYLAVADEAKKYVPSDMHDWLTRKTTKRTVMTIPYNATKSSSRVYIREALREQGFEPTPEQVSVVVDAVYKSMDAIVPGPMRVMRWIKKHVGQYIRDGATEVEWTTPSGFVVNQQRNKRETERLELQLLGRTTVSLTVGKGDPCPTRHKSSTAPNLIHSLDASILHCSFQQFDEPFTVIHDSVLARAGDMGTLNTLVRKTYTTIFTSDCWLTRFGETIKAAEPPPLEDTLDPSTVEQSTYFFC